jgi:chromate transporter
MGQGGAPLGEIARVFLKLGTIGFGGPAAHVALMDEEVVQRRAWISRERFLDLVGATHLIPGPNSTELAIHIGRTQAGTRGLVVAGLCFILPAFGIVLACAWAYVRFGQLPAAERLLYGVKPVVLAVVVQALWSLGRTAVKTRALGALGVLSAAAVAMGVHELAVVFGGGVLMAIAAGGRPPASSALALAPLLPAAAAAPPAVGLTSLFLFFLKVGSVLFGSGYVLLAFLRADLVERWGWMTEAQLLDAVAVGQVTPGPVFTTATFIGYLLGGLSGAALATLGIFLPSFVFVALSAPLLPKLRASRRAGAFLDGVNVASLALMAVVTAHLARAALVDPLSIAVGLASVVLLVAFRLSSVWLILAGAALGLLLPLPVLDLVR